MRRHFARHAGSLAPWLMLGLFTALQAAPSAAGSRSVDPHTLHQALARRAELVPCAVKDLDCRAFTGTLAWRPDERRPMLSSRALRRVALVGHLPGGQRERALRCLAFIAWAEARSDGVAGMRGVLAVVLNRSRAPSFPVHPCEVIGAAGAFEPMVQGGYRATALALKQRRLVPFPRPRNPIDAAALQTARLLVWNLAQGAAVDDPTRGATHFVAPKALKRRGQALPAWTRRMVRTARIGGHDFFRLPDVQLARQP